MKSRKFSTNRTIAPIYRLFLPALLMFICTMLTAQYTIIPDANFEQRLIDLGIDSEGTLDGQILTSDAEVATGTLTVANRDIASLEGIEAFVNITQLRCDRNSLTSLDVSSLSGLEMLHCWENSLTSLNVNGLTNLWLLNTSSNLLPSLDISSCTALTTLGCGDNQLTELEVGGLTSLFSVGCSDNLLASLDVSGLTGLEELNCSRNQMTTLDVSGCTILKTLECNENAFTILDLGFVSNLENLSCHDNMMSTLVLDGLPALRNLHCGFNSLTSLDLSLLPNLQNLYCYNNQLVSLDLSQNPLINNIECTGNALQSLDLRNGSNENPGDVYATNNPDLSCINVDDPDNTDAEYWQLPPGAILAVECNQPPDCSGAFIPDQEADANCEAVISGDDVTGITDPDANDLTITVSPSTLYLGPNTVTVTAEDGNGGICSIDIIVFVTSEGPDPFTPATWYEDADEDGYGNPDVDSIACTQPAGYVLDGTDCDDTDPSTQTGNPTLNAELICTQIENDCDGTYSYIVDYEATGECGQDPLVLAVATIPQLVDPVVKYKFSLKRKLKFNLAANKVTVSAPIPFLFWWLVQTTNGVLVSNGQEVDLVETGNPNVVKYKFNIFGQLIKVHDQALGIRCEALYPSGTSLQTTAVSQPCCQGGGGQAITVQDLDRILDNHDSSNLTELQVFPNPSSGQIQLSIPESVQPYGDIRIVDARGMTIWQQSLRTGQVHHLDLRESQIKNGAYWIQVYTADRVLSRQLIIVR